MKLSSVWWAGSNEYICAVIADYGLSVPQKICGVPMSRLLQLARDGDLLIEWVSRHGYLIYRLGADEDGISSLGANANWDAPSELGAIYLNFNLPASAGAREAMAAAEAAGTRTFSRSDSYYVYKDFLP